MFLRGCWFTVRSRCAFRAFFTRLPNYKNVVERTCADINAPPPDRCFLAHVFYNMPLTNNSVLVVDLFCSVSPTSLHYCCNARMLGHSCAIVQQQRGWQTNPGTFVVLKVAGCKQEAVGHIMIVEMKLSAHPNILQVQVGLKAQCV